MHVHTSAAAAWLDAIPAPVLVAGRTSGRVISWNTEAERWCGVSLLQSASLSDLVSPVGGVRLAESIAASVHTNAADRPDIDAELATPNGSIPVAVSMRPFVTSQTPEPAVVVLCYPMRHRSQAIAALARNEQRLEVALSAARLGSWEFDVRTRKLSSTAQCKLNHGFSVDEDMQLHPHIADAVDPAYRERFLNAIDDAIRTRGSFEIEVPHRWPDGSDHWLHVAGRMVDDVCVVGVSEDITERRHIEHALRSSEEHYRAIVEAANEGIWRLDRNARITFVNQRMAQMLGWPPEEMIGRCKWDFVFDDDVPEMQALFKRRQQGVSEEVADIRFRHRNGGEIWTLMSARPLYDETATFTGAVDLFTDITVRRRAEQQLREVDQRKDEFLAVLAHELRGPLAPIITAVSLLQQVGPAEPRLVRLRATILRQTLQLSTLVEDLLDIGRITQGKLRLEKTPVDLCTVVRQAVETAAPSVKRHGHSLRLTLPETAVVVNGDRGRLVQVASNLLSNATKYTPDGGTIEVGVRREENRGTVFVRDNGVGIPPHMLGRIFDRFVQIGGAPGARDGGGLGIGLSVVKALIDLHGGTVEAFSAGAGTGSTFVFRLPLGTGHEDR